MTEREIVLMWIFSLMVNGSFLLGAIRHRRPPAVIVIFGLLFCVALDGFLSFVNALPFANALPP